MGEELQVVIKNAVVVNAIIKKFYWQAITLILGIVVLCFPSPVLAVWTHPLSFSNAELSRHNFAGESLQAAEFSNANLEMTNFVGADLRGAVLSASVMTQANLQGADLTNAMVDQVNLTGANLSDVVLKEALLLANVNIEGADFTDAILDKAQIKELCTKASGVNTKTGVETRDSLGCR